MKKECFKIIIILTIGFVMLPAPNYACGTKTQKSCCEKVKTENLDKKKCCNNKSSNDTENSCGGKCGHSNCTSSTSLNFTVIGSHEFNIKDILFDFSTEKLKFYHLKTITSSGFYSIWGIPKIA